MIGSYSRSNLELKPVGILEVKLVQAKNLTNKDIIGKSDPYAVIFVRSLRDRTKTSKIMVRQPLFPMEAFFTFTHLLLCGCNPTAEHVQNNQLNPVWNEHFEFIIEDASMQHLNLVKSRTCGLTWLRIWRSIEITNTGVR